MANYKPEELKEAERIKIDTVFGDKDKDDLKNCFFFPTTTPGAYNFYNKEGTVLLAGGVFSGTSFTFQLDGHHWRVGDLGNPNDFIISDRFAAGTWSNTDPSVPPPGEVDGESGTFQAQSGGSGGADLEKAASSAKA